MKRVKFFMLIFLSFAITLNQSSSAMSFITNVNSWFWGANRSQEEEYLQQIIDLESIKDAQEFASEVEKLPTDVLQKLLVFLKEHRLDGKHSKFRSEAEVQMAIRADQAEMLEEDLIANQVQFLYDMLQKRDSSIIHNIIPEQKDSYINFIKKFRKEHNAEHAYHELYDALTEKVSPVFPPEDYYPTTIETTMSQPNKTPLITHIINLNALELAGPICQVTKDVHVGIEDYDNIIATHGDLPDNLDTLSKKVTVETLCNPLIAQRQTQQECGLMSIYNALQLYKFLNKKIDKSTFEQSLHAFNLDEWITEVERCPIDTSDIINIMMRRAPEITKNQYTIIPTIVNENGKLAYHPLENKNTVILPNGDIETNFDQDVSLLHAIRNIFDQNIPIYTHIFFLNNLEIDIQTGASTQHWIPAVLHKEHGQIYLYTLDSQSIFYENLMDESDKVVNLDMLDRVIKKDNIWLLALTELLQITNPNALAHALEIANQISSDSPYKHTLMPDLITALEHDDSELATKIREIITQYKAFNKNPERFIPDLYQALENDNSDLAQHIGALVNIYEVENDSSHKHEVIPEILKRLEHDNSELANEIKLMLTR